MFALLALTVFIELTGEPAAVTYARERAMAAKGAITVDQIARVEEQQQAIVTALPDGTFRYSMSRALNGIVAELDDDDIARIAAMPNVKRVVPMMPLSPDLTASVALVGAPAVWAQAGGRRGDGIRIGILDTGVDYLHVDLGGSGVYSRTNFTTAMCRGTRRSSAASTSRATNTTPVPEHRAGGSRSLTPIRWIAKATVRTSPASPPDGA
jgi:hypothetical protein